MHTFTNTKAGDWVNLLRVQMKASHDSNNANRSGYACICVGKKFDEVIEQHYSEIDEVTGEYLHIFTLFPPPPKLYEDRILRLENSSFGDRRKQEVIRKLKEDLSCANRLYGREKGTIIDEKVRLLRELSKVGIPLNQYIDFIFFSFERNEEETIVIHCAKTSYLSDGDSYYKFIDFFEKMGQKATDSFINGKDISVFLSSMNWQFKTGLILRRGIGIFKYIKEFISFFHS